MLGEDRLRAIIILAHHHQLLLGPLDGVAGLVPENEFPFIPVPRAYLTLTNTLPTMGTLLVALYKVRERRSNKEKVDVPVALQHDSWHNSWRLVYGS